MIAIREHVMSARIPPPSLTITSGIRQVNPAGCSAYNRPVFRRVTAAALVVLVQVGVISAPLAHVHLDDADTDHHHGRARHTHFAAHPGPVMPVSGRVLDHQDSTGRTASAAVFVTAAAAPFTLPAFEAAEFLLVVPSAAAGGRTPHVSHGHDPPETPIAFPPRAPPSARP